MKHLKLVNAASDDLDTIRSIYWELLDSSEEYASILRWKKDIYPADEDWLSYIAKGEMHLIWDECNLIGAVALAKSQPEDYRKVRWTVDARDDEVAVAHLLAIRPQYQGQGIGSNLLSRCMKRYPTTEWIAETTEPCVSFYGKHGFAAAAAGEDCVFMRRSCPLFDSEGERL